MKELPEPWRKIYLEKQKAIRQRLQDFSAIPTKQYFYELTYCILTPQSSAKNAAATVAELERDKFYEVGFDPTDYLRDPKHYIRFHNVKSKRLLKIRDEFEDLLPYLSKKNLPPNDLRALVLEKIHGFGMKEASHFLRNIGVRELAILDRHIFKHLARLGVIEEIPRNAPTPKRYLEIEKTWHSYSKEIGIPLDELDLLFWSMETGEIRK